MRNCIGSNTAEFGAAFAILVCLIVLPLLSAVFIPVRYSMCQNIIGDFTNRLARCETRSSAYRMMDENEKLRQLLGSCGATVKDYNLVLVATSRGGQKNAFGPGSAIPDEWLPDGKLGGCIYSLHLDCDCAISPIFSGGSISGFNAPVTLKVSSSANWTNVARDPRSPDMAFYLQE